MLSFAVMTHFLHETVSTYHHFATLALFYFTSPYSLYNFVLALHSIDASRNNSENDSNANETDSTHHFN
jgi:hypothetical protein